MVFNISFFVVTFYVALKVVHELVLEQGPRPTWRVSKRPAVRVATLAAIREESLQGGKQERLIQCPETW